MIKAKNQAEKQLLADKIGGNCPFSSDMGDKNSSTGQSICENCGTLFKTKNNSNYCSECKEIFYDEP